mmetsp:Transcript_119611/g.381686  ORF Transcript_119611/g.381686 Transcript_119611/m.381686 type:complete len:289 (+) Transcript_119611:126-992(+)
MRVMSEPSTEVTTANTADSATPASSATAPRMLATNIASVKLCDEPAAASRRMTATCPDNEPPTEATGLMVHAVVSDTVHLLCLPSWHRTCNLALYSVSWAKPCKVHCRVSQPKLAQSPVPGCHALSVPSPNTLVNSKCKEAHSQPCICPERRGGKATFMESVLAITNLNQSGPRGTFGSRVTILDKDTAMQRNLMFWPQPPGTSTRVTATAEPLIQTNHSSRQHSFSTKHWMGVSSTSMRTVFGTQAPTKVVHSPGIVQIAVGMTVRAPRFTGEEQASSTQKLYGVFR